METPVAGGALPNLVVIGAMKCGTTALHGYLDRHPEVAMSRAKELNFFFGPDTAPADPRPYGHPSAWCAGNWHRGPRWYAAQFDPAAAVRGESSPGYTSPSRPEVAGRIAAHLPGVHLVYLVRDPVERALSQYRHHAAEGTETRPPGAALLDPDSQYLARSRYFARLAPFLRCFPPGRVSVLALETLRADRRGTLGGLFARLGVDPERYPWESLPPLPPAGGGGRYADGALADGALRRRLADAVRDDAGRLRAYLGADLPGWCV